MALEYFLYRTDFSNTIIDRSVTSFTLTGNTGQIQIDFFIPEIQPLYLYKEDTGAIVINDDATIQSWLNFSNPIEEADKVLQTEYTGYTETNDIRVTNTETAIISVDNDVTYVSGQTSGNTEAIAAQQIEFTGYTATTKIEIDNKVDKVTGGTDHIAFFEPDGNIFYVSGLTLGFLTGGTGTYYYLDQTIRIETINDVTTPAIYLSGSTTVTEGRFSVDFNAIGGNSQANKYLGIQFQIDDITVGHETKFKTNAGDVDYSANVTKDLDLTTGTHTFRIIFYQQAGGTAYIEYGAIRVRKVS